VVITKKITLNIFGLKKNKTKIKKNKNSKCHDLDINVLPVLDDLSPCFSQISKFQEHVSDR